MELITAIADETTGAYTLAPTVALSDGDYSLTVTATDASNISDESNPLSITVDTTAPTQPAITTTTSLKQIIPHQ